jgi:hypothetical protein
VAVSGHLLLRICARDHSFFSFNQLGLGSYPQCNLGTRVRAVPVAPCIGGIGVGRMAYRLAWHERLLGR